MPNESDRTKRALKLIMDRGVISKDKSLVDLIRISEELANLPGGVSDERGYWEFIGPNFIWRGWDIARLEEIRTNPR